MMKPVRSAVDRRWRNELRRALLVVALWLPLASEVTAQELRVYSRTFDISRMTPDEESSAPVMARSLTLFHAGKVYDFVDSTRELTIFEPAHRRFTVFHEDSEAVAIVSQDEVRQYLTLALRETQKLADRLAREDQDGNESTVRFLRSQWDPRFTIESDPVGRQLRLRGTYCTYEVATIAPPAGFTAESYLRYADAVAEFNAVLHPRAPLPASRLRLNEALREQHVLPLVVRRRIDAETKSVFKVEHEWSWQLSDHDRQRISHWENQLRRKDLRQLPFKQLQHQVLTGKVTQR